MSVYIKGMEMPKVAGRIEAVIYIHKDGSAIIAISPSEDQIGYWKEYPLIPVPEHGDLIERDALKKECQENAKRGIGLWVDYMDVSLAPTIIPADKEEQT